MKTGKLNQVPKSTEIITDYECNAEEWWDALRDYSTGLYAEHVKALLRGDAITVTDEQEAQLLAVFRRLPGWETGIAHAPHPVIVRKSRPLPEPRALLSFLPFSDREPYPTGGYGSCEEEFETRALAEERLARLRDEGRIERAEIYVEDARCPFGRRLVTDWNVTEEPPEYRAARGIWPEGAPEVPFASDALLEGIIRRALTPAVCAAMRTGFCLTWEQAEELGDMERDWIRYRMELDVETDNEGVTYRVRSES